MTREEANNIAKGITDKIESTTDIDDWAEFWGFTREDYEEFLEMSIKTLEQEPYKDMGEVSDGYHTFNQLYHQRAVLFATIVKQNKDKSWKSFKHFDGKYCFDSNGEWFIVGIDTPKGSYTYHYSKEYWDMFDCKELECGKKWDGHTEEDVTRLLSLEQEPKSNGRLIDADELLKRISEKAKISSLSEDTVNGLCGATAIIYDMLNESEE